MESRTDLKRAFRDTLPVLAGYVFLGFAFGLLMISKGYPAWYPIAMSVLIYSGALEYAAVPLVAGPLSLLSSFVMGLLLSVRHLFYGIPVMEKYNKAGKEKAFLIFGLTDETFSLLSTRADCGRVYMTVVTGLNYLYWNIGTALGALLGTLLPIAPEGLDFALTALFLVMLLEQMKTREGIIGGVTGLVCAALALAFFGAGNLVPAAICMMVPILLLIQRRDKA